MFKKILTSYDEKVLTTDFTFGFELEAHLEYRNAEEVVERLRDGEYLDEVAEDFIDHFMQLAFNKVEKYSGNGNMQSDSSLSESRYKYPFEWASPIYKFSPQNILEVIKGLNFLFVDNQDIFSVDNSCGFHIHLGFPNLSENLKEINMLWIAVNLISKMINDNDDIIRFLLTYKGIKIYDDYYASIESFYSIIDDIERELDDGREEYEKKEIILRNLRTAYTSRKYNLFHFHERYGTIEWRGPRGFLSEGTDMIKGFFLERLYPLVMAFSNFMDKNYTVIQGIQITRKDIERLVKSGGELIRRKDSITKYFATNMHIKDITEILSKYSNLRPPNGHKQNISGYIENGKLIIDGGSFTNGVLDQPMDLRKEVQDIFLRDMTINNKNINIFVSFSGRGDISIYDTNFENIGKVQTCFIYSSKINNGLFLNCKIQNSELDNCELRGCDIFRCSLNSEVVIKECELTDLKSLKTTEIYNSKLQLSQFSHNEKLMDLLKKQGNEFI